MRSGMSVICVRPLSSTIRAEMSIHLFPIFCRQGKNPKKYQAGFINAEGEVVIDAVYENARSFSEELAPIQVQGRWGAIDRTGKIAIPCVHHELGLRFSEGRISFTANM